MDEAAEEETGVEETGVDEAAEVETGGSGTAGDDAGTSLEDRSTDSCGPTLIGEDLQQDNIREEETRWNESAGSPECPTTSSKALASADLSLDGQQLTPLSLLHI